VKSRANARFWDLFRQLPTDIQDQARQAYKLFTLDPKHPGLQFKRVSQKRPVYSARVTRNHRALGVLDGEGIIWYWIGNHEDYDRMLARR
jgi:hypothetical protein